MVTNVQSVESNEFQPLQREQVTVWVCIRDEHNKEGVHDPWVKKMMAQISFCPDHTHLRFYFQDGTFLAVPLVLPVQQKGREWCAHDREAGLSYVIKMEEKVHA
ncbi:hypothetical protein HUG20_02060 [Salicibibacter cibi]|uniref:Uncharacterized protein n=1 Tax=Salicibibacter cibi TaxID=2743001 RepID=A0A7T6Z9C6_9BACI|nr:hypothetical protein [Salicibibacter cibi]QQK78806.1 hypothetical protein HUG20_02060 [Salicibibacter cibi]